jgi:hypothetical protein
MMERVGTLDARAIEFAFTRAGMLFDSRQVEKRRDQETLGWCSLPENRSRKSGLERSPARFSRTVIDEARTRKIASTTVEQAEADCAN